jgi:hypothetical protein
LITGIRAARIGLAPIIAAIIAAIIAVIGIPAGLRIRFRRGTAIRRIAKMFPEALPAAAADDLREHVPAGQAMYVGRVGIEPTTGGL